MKGKTFAYPASIDLDMLAHQYSVGATTKQFQKYRDAFAFIIGSIHFKALSLKDDDEISGSEENQVRLSSKILKFIFGNKYNLYIDFLIEQQGVIYMTDDYSTFTEIHHSRAYAITEKWICADHKVKWHTLQDENKSDRIEESFEKQTSSEILSVTKSYKYITMYLDDGELQIDEEKAIAELDKVLIIDQEANLLGGYNKKITPEERYTLNKLKVLNFNNSISEYTVDNSGYRLHTSLVRLPKYLRKHVKYKGQHLVSLDLKNSQPFLLCALLNKKLWDSSTTLCVQKLYPEFYKKLNELTTIQKKKIIYMTVFNKNQIQDLVNVLERSSIISIIAMLSNLLESPVNNKTQGLNIKKLHNFKQLCVSGTLYEEMGNMFKDQFLTDGQDPFGTREMVKIQTMLIFYGNYKKGGLKFIKPVKAFIDAFPEIGNLLLLLKSVGYKYSPCLLQRLESNLILKEVATELYRRKISPVFTVHDSIVVLPKYAEEAEQIMSDVIFNKTDLRPKIKPEEWK